MDPTWIVRLDAPGEGPRLAVKDCIDVEGLPTTAGCQAVAEQAGPAVRDAPVVAAARRAGARVVGKTSPTQLGWSAGGGNPRPGAPGEPGGPPPGRVGRTRPAPDLGVDPATDAAVDAALAGLQVTDVTGFDFRTVNEAGNVSIDVEAYQANAYLLPRLDQLAPHNRRSMTESAQIT